MVIIRSPDSATGQPGCQEYRTWERCSIRDTVAVNRFGCRCLRGAAAGGVLAGADGAGWAGWTELAGGGGNSLGVLPPQPALASASTVTSTGASTAGATAARILPTPAEPTRNLAAGGRHRRGPGN